MAYTEHQIYLFLLILVRTTSMFLSAPFFSFKGVPFKQKVGLGGLMAFILFPVVDAGGVQIAFNHVSAILLVFKEVMVGITVGLILGFLFAGVELAGEFIGMDMGLSMVQIYDPNFNQTMSAIAKLKNIMAILIFIILEGHHFLIEAIAFSYKVLPIGDWLFSNLALEKIMRISAQVFVIGVKIAAPAVVALFLTTVAMGIIARAVPQMNIFFVGFPLRIGVGLFFIGFGFPVFVYLFKGLLENFQKDIIYLLKVM